MKEPKHQKKLYNICHKPTHDAMDDILATSEILLIVLKNKIIPTSIERIERVNKHLPIFKYISEQLTEIFNKAKVMRPQEIVKYILNKCNLENMYQKVQIYNLIKLYNIFKEMDDPTKNNKDSLIDILKVTALSNGDMESLMILNNKKVKIPIITIHQAKGLEFDVVFIAGMQENKFPSYKAVKSGKLEEEKRAFYVALTRAREKLYISSNQQGSYGRLNDISRFMQLLPEEYIEIIY